MRKNSAKKKRGLGASSAAAAHRHRASTAASASDAAAKAKARKPKPPGAAAPGTPASSPPAIPAPTPIPGFSTGADLASINDYLTNYATSVEDIDNQLAGLKTDTAFQKAGNDKQAKAATGETADQMAGRGIFQSSVKDAALYDIEAQRALSNKFLDDKLTTATLQAGTRKRTLAEGKKRFDTAMLLQQGENAAPANDAANQAYADRRAAAATAAPPAPTTPKFTAQPGTDSKGRPGTWHIYPDGHRVFVRQ